MQNIDSAKYQEILDNKCGSCINSLEAFKGLGHYVVWLQLSPWLGHFSAAVTFKTPVRCVDRQVLKSKTNKEFRLMMFKMAFFLKRDVFPLLVQRFHSS